MHPFVKQLALRFVDPATQAFACELGRVKRIATTLRLLMNSNQIGGDSSKWGRRRPEPGELRVMLVSFGGAAQDFLGQQRLAPKSDQSLGVEIPRMKRPQPHNAR